MNSSFCRILCLLVALGFVAVVSPAAAQLDRCLDAHGGLAKWKSYGAVEFDLAWTSAKGAQNDHELFDLRSRAGLITCDKYTLGTANGEVWIKPALNALGGTPPRFYMWTPFYFFGMPFVFADPGGNAESLGRKSFQGEEYDTFKITFKKGTGDTPDDFYVIYVEPALGRLKLASYVVTFPSMRKGRPIEQLEQHAIVFEEWQSVNGLQVPKKAPFYKWKEGNIEGSPLGTLEFSNVHLSPAPPDPSKFAKPPDAVVAPLQ